MSIDENKSSREIERDVEQTRADMTETLDELRARMSPGQILDEVLSYTRDTGGGKMMNNLGRTVQDNPAPLLLIGAGIAWMMASNRSPGLSGRYNWRGADWGPRSSNRSGWSDTAASVADTARHAGERVAHGISSMAGAATGKAADLRDSATRAAHDLSDAASQTGDSAYGQARDLGATVRDMLGEQPFVLGAIGVAIGATLGAALPETKAEDRLMGEASDALKDGIGAAASEGYEKVKTAAEKTLASATQQAEEQGLTPEGAENVLSDVGSKANADFETAKDAAVQEPSRQGLTQEADEHDLMSGRGS